MLVRISIFFGRFTIYPQENLLQYFISHLFGHQCGRTHSVHRLTSDEQKNRLVISPNFGGLAEGLEGPVLGLTESYKRIFVFFSATTVSLKNPTFPPTNPLLMKLSSETLYTEYAHAFLRSLS